MESSKGLEWKNFPSTTYDKWYQETVRLLKGADFNKRLVKESYDGLKVDPLYHQDSLSGREEELSRPMRYYSGPFKKVQEFLGFDESLSREAQLALTRGVDEVVTDSFELLRVILNRFDIKNQRISFRQNRMDESSMVQLKHILEQKGLPSKTLMGSLYK